MSAYINKKMIDLTIILAIFAALLVGAGLAFTLARRGRGEELLEVRMQALESVIKDIKTDVGDYLKSSRSAIDSSSRLMQTQVRDFTKSITQMQENLGRVYESVQSSTDKMSAFQNIFKTPKLRGQWGEANLEYLLTQVYPSSRILHQHYFKSGEAVDFAIKLPNDLILPIDSKFPLETYVSYAEEEDEQTRRQKKQNFVRRVKDEISSIASKYIKPEEGTVDRAILFVPAESVYYDIMFSLKDAELAQYAYKKHVVLASPNTLNLTLSVFEHWFKDIELSKKTGEIMKRLGGVVVDAEKLGDNFEKIGKHIDNTKSAYESTSKRLGLLTDRVKKVIKLGDKKAQELSKPEE